MLNKAEDETLEAYLLDKVFASGNSLTVQPDPNDVAGFASFMSRYKKGLVIEQAAVEGLK